MYEAVSTGMISIKYEQQLNDRINDDCADVFVPMVACAEDIRKKIPRCIKNKCTLITKHICCTFKDDKRHKQEGCDSKKVSCAETSFN